MQNKKQKLSKKFKRDWIKALRSGEYEQGTTELYRNGKYCCLGVAAKILNIPLSGGDDPYTQLPEAIRWENGKRSDACGKLINMNDSQEKTFPEIADWIEENL